jgi:nucleoside phosphorylase
MIDDIQVRKDLAREILSAGYSDADYEMFPTEEQKQAGESLMADLGIDWPAGLAPVPQPITPAPGPNQPLPKADVVVITWTVDELMALCDVLTPKFNRDKWYRYARFYQEKYDAQIRKGAPAKTARRLGSYMPAKIGKLNVLCMKSELHMNQDGIEDPDNPGTATLPVKTFFQQIIEETGAKVIITAGTAGGVYTEQDLGDVVVTRGAHFKVQKEFKEAPFAGKTYTDDWDIPTKHFKKAEELMQDFKDHLEPAYTPAFPPTAYYTPNDKDHVPHSARQPIPAIWLDGADVPKLGVGKKMPKFHPILTTDFFEFGTSANHLDKTGSAVEMGDAVLGLVVQELKDAGKPAPNWAVVRNCSDPQINGELVAKPSKISQQALWAVYYYKGYGYWTSVMGAIACWAIVAGLSDKA